MPKITNQSKKELPLILILLLIILLAVIGGIYYFSPAKSPELIPTSAEVSSSTNVTTLEKELDYTDLGSFETDLNQLDTEAEQL